MRGFLQSPNDPFSPTGPFPPLGLGIDRRLRTRGRRRRLLPRQEASFWYIANRLGRRFLQDAEATLGGIEVSGPGLWRSRVLGRLVFLVSTIDLPVEEDSLPLHLVGQEPPDTERQVAWLVLERPELQARYAGWVASLHPAAWREVEAMARTKLRGPTLDLRPAIEYLGLDYVIEQVGIDRVIDAVGLDRVLERRGDKEVVKRIGLERFLACLSPAERRELKRRLEG
jgi:hypothetical protein